MPLVLINKTQGARRCTHCHGHTSKVFQIYLSVTEKSGMCNSFGKSDKPGAAAADRRSLGTRIGASTHGQLWGGIVRGRVGVRESPGQRESCNFKLIREFLAAAKLIWEK